MSAFHPKRTLMSDFDPIRTSVQSRRNPTVVIGVLLSRGHAPYPKGHISRIIIKLTPAIRAIDARQQKFGRCLMRRLVALLAVGAAITLATPAQAVVIDFDTLSSGDVITTQYPGVTFSSEVGSQVLVNPQAVFYGTSVPNFICS